MKIAKKYFQGIALFFFLIILPIGSYMYLLTGLDFYKENRAEYAKKGMMPEFSAKSLYSNTQLTRNDLLGHTFIFSFFDAKAPESDSLVKQMALVQEQFKNRKDIKHVTFLSDSLTAANKKLFEEAQPIKNKWHVLEGDSTTSSFMKSQFKLADIKDNYSPEFILVDDSLNIRGYYNVLNETRRNKLIIHLSMIMPLQKREEIVFKREKEK